MDIQIISIIAAIISVSGFVIYLIRRARKLFSEMANRINNLEASLKTRQVLVFAHDTQVMITGANKVIEVSAQTELVVTDYPAPGWVTGKIFHNQVEVQAELSALKIKS